MGGQPALTNGSLNSGAGWSTQGGVEIGNGAATLSEVSGSQTRLSQAFLLNPTDRFLSFTLAGTALDDLTGAPDDAFEVALLDANSGASLLGSNGLTAPMPSLTCRPMASRTWRIASPALTTPMAAAPIVWTWPALPRAPWPTCRLT